MSGMHSENNIELWKKLARALHVGTTIGSSERSCGKSGKVKGRLRKRERERER